MKLPDYYEWAIELNNNQDNFDYVHQANSKVLAQQTSIAHILAKYRVDNQMILSRRPDLKTNSDFSPEGIKLHLNEVFIEELQAVLDAQPK